MREVAKIERCQVAKILATNAADPGIVPTYRGTLKQAVKCNGSLLERQTLESLT